MNLGNNSIDFFQPQVMAIVNITDDSFYEGCRAIDEKAIAQRVREVIREGATIVDVGGYSSRPGAVDITIEQEWQRVRMGLRAVREVSRDVVAEGVKAVDLTTDHAAIFASKGEMRKLVQGGGVSVNKEKLSAFDQVINSENLLNDKYILVQKGKKNYYLIIVK